MAFFCLPACHLPFLAWQRPWEQKPVFLYSLLVSVWFVVVVQLLSCVRLFVPPLTSVHQASLSFTVSHSLLKFMSVQLVVLSNHLILWCPVSFCIHSFPASGSFSMSWLFPSGGQSIRASALASVLPMNIQDRFPLELNGLISLQSKTLKSLLQLHISKASIVQCSAFFMIQLSHSYITAGKTIAMTILNFVGKVMSLLYDMLSSFVLAFLPRRTMSFKNYSCTFWPFWWFPWETSIKACLCFAFLGNLSELERLPVWHLLKACEDILCTATWNKGWWMGQTADRPKKPGKEEAETEDIWKNKGIGELSRVLRYQCATHVLMARHTRL